MSQVAAAVELVVWLAQMVPAMPSRSGTRPGRHRTPRTRRCAVPATAPGLLA